MKARILKTHGVLQPGQILTVADTSAYPAGVAEYFDDDDPAIITVREPGSLHPIPSAPAGEVAPLKGSDFAKSQAAKVKAVEQEHADRVAAQQQAPMDAEKAAKPARK